MKKFVALTVLMLAGMVGLNLMAQGVLPAGDASWGEALYSLIGG